MTASQEQSSATPTKRSGQAGRIGLLTYHRSVNDGSIMQAYCLYRLLERMVPEATVEIIDYMPRSLQRRHARLALRGLRPPFVNPRYVWTYREQQAFLQRHCRYSAENLVSDELGEAQRFIDSLHYDAIVVGSDTAWELERTPRPPNAYFRPSLQIPTFAFAVSADPVPGPTGPWRGQKLLVRQALEQFEVITVRDRATSDFLDEVGVAPGRVGYVPDPTLLVDFGHHVDKRAAPGSGDRPLAALAARPGVARLLHPVLTEAGFQVISLMGSRQLPGAEAPPALSTIGRRLGVYRSFDFVVTDRFHMTIFALKLGRGPVVFLEDVDRWPRPNSKGRDLLERLGLGDLVWRVDRSEIAAGRVRMFLEVWPEASSDLPGRLTALRVYAEASGYAGVAPALRAAAARPPA